MAAQEKPVGRVSPADAGSPFNQTHVQTNQALGRVRTMVHGKILAVHNRNDLTKPCTVDWQPLIKLLDGRGQAASHGTVYGTPVTRSIGGDSAIINDPKEGDVGVFGIGDRDAKSAQANDWTESNPGSNRRFSFSDATYHGPLPRKSAVPKNYVLFNDDGIKVAQRDGPTIVLTKDGVTITAEKGVTINGATIDKQGNISTPGTVTAGKGSAESVTLQGHTHAAGPAPTPGT